MNPHIALVAARVAALLLLASTARAAAVNAAPSAETLCRSWFGAEAVLAPLQATPTNALVRQVTRNGQPAGWIFRTDQIPPACKGKRGEIVLLVALGTDARIKGVQILSHREDPAYFKRLKSGFFDQFNNLLASGSEPKVDAVTRATLSSRAIIREVVEGARHVAALPEVACKINASQQCSLTKMPPVSHN